MEFSRKLFFLLLLAAFTGLAFSHQITRHRRLLLQESESSDVADGEESVLPAKKNKVTIQSVSTTNQAKLAKPNSVSLKNNTKTNSSNSTKKLADLRKSSSISTKKIKQKEKATTNNEDRSRNPSQLSSIHDTQNVDLVSDFRDLPAKFQRTIIPDLKRISSSSKSYLSSANKEITRGFKPYVGGRAATAISISFLIIPFAIVSLLFTRIKAYFSLQKLLLSIQVYLSVYFAILCLSAIVTELEPLRYLYATSRPTYVWLQALQALGYVIFLLLLVLHLVLVFSTGSGPRLKLLGLAQTFVGFAVGLHYYMMVLHMVVLRQPPMSSGKMHAMYATCFLVVCLAAAAGRRKKAYLGDGGEEDKKS